MKSMKQHVRLESAAGAEPAAANSGAPAGRRAKKAKRSVLVADRIADRVITVGGILVIIAVLGIMVFLVQAVIPLFKEGRLTDQHTYRLELPSGKVLAKSMDEHQTLAYMLLEDGTTALFHLKTGTRLESPVLDFEANTLRTTAHTPDRRNLAFGFEDGTIRFASVNFVSDILRAEEVPAGLTRLNERDSTDGIQVFSRIPGDQVRRIRIECTLEETEHRLGSGTPIVAMDYRLSGEAERQSKAIVAVDQSGEIYLNLATTQVNLLTGERRVRVRQTVLPSVPVNARTDFVLLTQGADSVLVGDIHGFIYRYNTTDFADPYLAETVRVLPEGIQLTALEFLLGGRSLLVGGSDGSVTIHFLVQSEQAGTLDGQVLAPTRRFAPSRAAVRWFEPSLRGKNFAVADDTGRIRVINGTSQKKLFSIEPREPVQPHRGLVLAPRVDGLLVLDQDGTTRFFEFSVSHPETTLAGLFGKVWYEGYSEPSYTWQSSAATEDYEPKFSLIPLIFGTIKATFYSLLFAIPIALLAAIYTSEFVHFSVRGVVKPAMEMMASLPSVVLGFVAALILAPIVETWIAAVILAFAVVPLGLMAAAYLWQMIPFRISIRLEGIPKFALISAVVLLSLFLSLQGGSLFETLFFQGDFKGWVNGSFGDAAPFLFLILWPACFAVVCLAASRTLGLRVSRYMLRIRRSRAALLDAARWLALLVSSVLLSYVLARLLSGLGLDARGSFVDTYVQRNTLVVGFAMGFAVIPLIYTLAEDALNAVPEHLRAASLGCGATPWQTAVYVVIPTAVSGVFSAIMIGMGRAVGETMIVVMATGNTPLMDWNVFNGLRALSATIAVELPEAVKNGTLYRILFLAGLVLFAMTFIINTVAEAVRMRFRKRASRL